MGRGDPVAAYRRHLPGLRALPDARRRKRRRRRRRALRGPRTLAGSRRHGHGHALHRDPARRLRYPAGQVVPRRPRAVRWAVAEDRPRSEEHTSELQSLMRISYAVFCLKKKKKNTKETQK